MDPITTTLVAALAAGATAGVTDVGKQAIVDAYKRLKELIKSRFGKDNKVSQAITDLEQHHAPKGRQLVLAEQVAAQKLDQDPDVVNLAIALREALESTDAGRQAIAKYMINAKGAQVGVMGDHAHVEGGIHFGDPKK